MEHGYTISDDALRMMAEKGIYLVPTDYPAAFYVDALSPSGMSPAEHDREMTAARGFETRSHERLARAMKLGVKIAFGSDEYYDVPGRTRGQASLLPLEAYRDAGMSPLEVIRAATVNAADLIGWGDRLGVIEAGKRADIIAVDGDPLKDVRALEHARFVMKDGVVVRNDATSSR